MTTIQGMTQIDEKLCSQLNQFNERIRMYASRLWQLPITYLTAVSITASNISTSTPKQIQIIIGIGLLVIGLVIGITLIHYRNRINNLVVKTTQLESHMGLILSSVEIFKKRILALYEVITLIGLALSVFILIN